MSTEIFAGMIKYMFFPINIDLETAECVRSEHKKTYNSDDYGESNVTALYENHEIASQQLH